MLPGVYTGTKSDWVSSTSPGRSEMRHWWSCCWTRVNFSSVSWLCEEIEYCPLLDRLARTVPLTSTTMVPAVSCDWPGCTATRLAWLAIWLNTVTATPGGQSRLASLVRYCRATAWLLAKLALAARKPDTICSGNQFGPGGTGIGCREYWPLPAFPW